MQAPPAELLLDPNPVYGSVRSIGTDAQPTLAWQQFSAAVYLSFFITGAMLLALSIWLIARGRHQPVSPDNAILIIGVIGCILASAMMLVSLGFLAHFWTNKERLADRILVSTGPHGFDVFDVTGAAKPLIARDRAYAVRLVAAVMYASDTDSSAHENNRNLTELVQLQLLAHSSVGGDPSLILTIHAVGLFPRLRRHAQHFAEKSGLNYDFVRLHRTDLPSLAEWERRSQETTRNDSAP